MKASFIHSHDKVISIECLAKHECEVAGKLHQVLEEVLFLCD